jgi:hypothetical protein
MTPDDLRRKYGESKSPKQRMNAAIRAELPGGSEALDALAELRSKEDWRAETGGERYLIAGLRTALSLVRACVGAMADEIRRRYGFTHSRQDGPPDSAASAAENDDAPWLDDAPGV